MMVGNIKIVPTQGMIGHRVYLDGKEINGVTRIETIIDRVSIPTVDIELTAQAIEVDQPADVNFHLSAESVMENIAALRFQLMVDDDLRKAFQSSIQSALDEANNYIPNDRLAEQILNRIMDYDADL